MPSHENPAVTVAAADRAAVTPSTIAHPPAKRRWWIWIVGGHRTRRRALGRHPLAAQDARAPSRPTMRTSTAT